ncbi:MULTISPECIES: M48 family metalloprotease [Caballeronia]|uniref:M48 family metalloprotease n=1 Tax=Caballeronia TaxID=1827195 RepID=UPI00045EFC7F|nr:MULTISPECIES: M48 family metalloprotease [unclassified Caballeronia]MCE4542762.1 M48 family metalloprotease [Caballeronia sp. PC1]MCE4568182.1 M48 family metalloprotease [Caballeronia sp. CLC5]BAO85507.1 peptidase M48 Ste24p [Burkholderia sp. RPE67]
MHPTRLSRALASFLCIVLAMPPAALAQTGAPAAGANAVSGSGTLAASQLRASQEKSDVPGNVAEGVFGVYGGAESRFANRPGTMSGLRAPLASVQLPDLGDGSGGSLTPQAERKLGERMMREVRADPDYLDDWLLRDYLDSISSRLSAAAATQYLGGYQPDFDLFAVRDAQINAFSMPGGFIGVNTGLIAATQTESELASVVGHEMGHVLQRHIARMLGTQEKSSYAALAGMLAGLLAGLLAHSGDLGMGIAMGGQAFAVDNQLRFSRAAEHEADRVGFQMLTAAGYDPYAMTTFFERLDRSTMGDNGVPPYVRTHPLTTERIADMEGRARRVPYRQPRQSAEYAFVRARARVLQVSYASDYRDVASRLKTEIEDQTALNPASNWYGIALAQSLMGNYDAATDALAKARRLFESDEVSAAAASAQVQQEDRARTSKPVETAKLPAPPSRSLDASMTATPLNNARATLDLGNTSTPKPPRAASDIALPPVHVYGGTAPRSKPSPPSSPTPATATAPLRSTPSLDVLAADIARRAGRSDDAIRLADLAQKRWPESHAAIDVHLQALLAARRFAEAQALARHETRAEPARPDWWLYLAQASKGLNDPLQQHQAMAEKFALDGAWPSAIRQLKEARDVKTASFYDLSAISARLHDFEARYKEEREQERNG